MYTPDTLLPPLGMRLTSVGRSKQVTLSGREKVPTLRVYFHNETSLKVRATMGPKLYISLTWVDRN